MKALGIVAEYNPFHKGHLYHLKESKRLAGIDTVVVAMSGNYVQRGEPAILNKWDRTRLALENGADLVVEIPTFFCLGNAKQYAKASIFLLSSLGVVDKFSFGSECGDVNTLKSVANNLTEKEIEIEEGVKDYLKEGLSYPAAREKVYSRIFPFTSGTSILRNSNDNLAVNYLISNNDMEPIAVKRGDYIKASAIRKDIKNFKVISDLVPRSTEEMILNNRITYTDEWFSTLKFAIMQMTGEDIDTCPSGGEGLGNRVKHYINSANSWDELIKKTKSKRYTYTRISRLFMQIILGINNNKYSFDAPKYIRLLGANDKGRKLISHCEKKELNRIPIITNLSKSREYLDIEGILQLELDTHATNVYNLITGRDLDNMSDYKIPPIIL